MYDEPTLQSLHAFCDSEGIKRPSYRPPPGVASKFKSLEDAIARASTFEEVQYYMQEKISPGNIFGVQKKDPNLCNIYREDTLLFRTAKLIRSGQAQPIKRRRERTQEDDSGSSSSDSEGHPGYDHRGASIAYGGGKKRKVPFSPSPLSVLADTPEQPPNSDFEQSPYPNAAAEYSPASGLLSIADHGGSPQKSTSTGAGTGDGQQGTTALRTYGEEMRMLENQNQLAIGADPKILIDHRTPTRFQELMMHAKKTRQKPKMVIIVPPRKAAILNLTNAKTFLSEGVYDAVNANKSTLWSKRREMIVFTKVIDGEEFRVEIIDHIQHVEDWKAVVAVVVDEMVGRQEDDWQFLDWPFVRHVHLFSAIRGYYMHFRGTPIKSSIVNKCDVKVLQLKDYTRHEDHQLSLEFWSDLEKFLRTRSKMNYLQMKTTIKQHINEGNTGFASKVVQAQQNNQRTLKAIEDSAPKVWDGTIDYHTVNSRPDHAFSYGGQLQMSIASSMGGGGGKWAEKDKADKAATKKKKEAEEREKKEAEELKQFSTLVDTLNRWNTSYRPKNHMVKTQERAARNNEEPMTQEAIDEYLREDKHYMDNAFEMKKKETYEKWKEMKALIEGGYSFEHLTDSDTYVIKRPTEEKLEELDKQRENEESGNNWNSGDWQKSDWKQDDWEKKDNNWKKEDGKKDDWNNKKDWNNPNSYGDGWGEGDKKKSTDWNNSSNDWNNSKGSNDWNNSTNDWNNNKGSNDWNNNKGSNDWNNSTNDWNNNKGSNDWNNSNQNGATNQNNWNANGSSNQQQGNTQEWWNAGASQQQQQKEEVWEVKQDVSKEEPKKQKSETKLVEMDMDEL